MTSPDGHRGIIQEVFMKKAGFALVLGFVFALVSCSFASELSFQGTAPLYDKSTIGFGALSVAGSSGTLDTENLSIEFFWRGQIVEALDWGISLSPMTSKGFPGTPDVLFDTKTRLLKGSGIIPTLTLGVNLVRFAALDPANLKITPTFMDEGRLGFSWEYVTVNLDSQGRPTGEMKRNHIYAGVNIAPGSSTFGSRLYAGWQLSNLNIMAILENQTNSFGISYSF